MSRKTKYFWWSISPWCPLHKPSSIFHQTDWNSRRPARSGGWKFYHCPRPSETCSNFTTKSSVRRELYQTIIIYTADALLIFGEHRKIRAFVSDHNISRPFNISLSNSQLANAFVNTHANHQLIQKSLMNYIISFVVLIWSFDILSVVNGAVSQQDEGTYRKFIFVS